MSTIRLLISLTFHSVVISVDAILYPTSSFNAVSWTFFFTLIDNLDAYFNRVKKHLWYWYVIKDLAPLLPLVSLHPVLCPGCTFLKWACHARTPRQHQTRPKGSLTWGQGTWFLFHSSLLLQFCFLNLKRIYLEFNEGQECISISCLQCNLALIST